MPETEINSESPIKEQLNQINSELTELHETIDKIKSHLSIVTIEVPIPNKDSVSDEQEKSDMESYLDDILLGVAEATKRLTRLRNSLRL